MKPTREHKIPKDKLISWFSYNPDTGLFYRKVQAHYRWKVGDLAGSQKSVGYIQLWVDGKSVYAHRAAYVFMRGDWPPTGVDHINGDKKDNRWSNLRLATCSENGMNAKQKLGASGIRGVVFCPSARKYRAQIYIRRKRKTIGYFDNIADAQEARKRAEDELHEEFAFARSRGLRLACGVQHDR
jgi:hypothetical protein